MRKMNSVDVFIGSMLLICLLCVVTLTAVATIGVLSEVGLL
ncbi:hypothetical protein [Klebsiella phage P79_1]|uniref:Uncharacterized protein n=1 Tax=Klebsiella phage P79_1 TaxID=3065703 RepID=A0AAX4AM50_9CAUD|nr:hypothetical protein [Klebsiella phage P79_1]